MRTPASVGVGTHPLPDGTLEGSSGLPGVSDRVASAPRLWLRSRPTRRGSTRSQASARGQVKLVATMFASRRHLWRRNVSNRSFGPGSVQRSHLYLERSASLARGLAPVVDEDSVRTPSGVLSGTGNVADRFERLGGFAPQIHPVLLSIRESSTSCCRETLKWRPRTGGRAFVLLASRTVSPKIEKPHG